MDLPFIKARTAAALAAAAIIWLTLPPAAQTDAAKAAVAVAGVSQTAAQANLAKIEEKWGIRILALRVTAGGYMVDVRYQVRDVEKAAPVLGQENIPYMIDQESGHILSVPVSTVGRLRQHTENPQAERTYFMLFDNLGLVKAGSKVTIVVGEFRAEDLTITG